MRFAPIAFITATTGKNVKALLNHGQMLFKQARERVATGALNRMLRDAINRNPPPLYRNSRPKIYYATQVGIEPPTIVLFCSEPAAISKPYQRYLLSVFRDQLKSSEVPIKLYLRKRMPSDNRDEVEQHLPLEQEAATAHSAEVGDVADVGEVPQTDLSQPDLEP